MRLPLDYNEHPAWRVHTHVSPAVVCLPVRLRERPFMRSLVAAVAVVLSVPFVSLSAAMPGHALSIGEVTATRDDGAEQAPVPVMTLDNASLNFGALTSGGTFVRQTSPQVVRLTKSGAGTVTWTVASSSPWLQVSPASGSGNGTITVSVSANGVPASGTVNGTLVITYNGATTSSATVDVALRLQPNGGSASPFGFVDTPAQNATGVIGAIPVTGWALDDIQIEAVAVCRAPVAGEGAGPEARCGGQAQVYLSDAVFIEGARPDLPRSLPYLSTQRRSGLGHHGAHQLPSRARQRGLLAVSLGA